MKEMRYPGVFAHPELDYLPFDGYARERGRISMEEMRADATERVNLFAVREHYDFEALEEWIEQVNAALPAMRRIFSRPITRLKDQSEILPVEAVRVVNNRTMIHASSHSELWSDLTPDGIKPRKLMTVHYEDEYAIYENLLLVRCVDTVLGLIQRNLRILGEMLEGGGDWQVNLLDRRFHSAYVLALGKLHYGFVREYETYHEPAARCVEKLLFLQRALISRRNTPLYRHCTGKGEGLTLTRTNIFRGHKDYARVYTLLRWMNRGGMDVEQERPALIGDGYHTFLTLLTVFAAEHFGFDFSKSETVDFTCFEAGGSMRGWYLMIDTLTLHGHSALRLTFFKTRLWRALILPMEAEGEEGSAMLAEIGSADGVYVADPWEMGEGRVHLSRYDPDSFPRIWQILMTGMLMSDTEHHTCPFCGGAMRPITEEDRYEAEAGMRYLCPTCETVIGSRSCPKTGRDYPISTLWGYEPTLPRDVESIPDALSRRDLQRALYFRNVTPLGPRGELLCPFCASVHGDSEPEK